MSTLYVWSLKGENTESEQRVAENRKHVHAEKNFVFHVVILIMQTLSAAASK